MINNKLRIGNFTSSEIHKLVKSGRGKDAVFSVAGETYINKKANEVRMKRGFDVGAYSQSLAWGEIMEMFVFAELGVAYKPVSKGTLLHPKQKGWAGTADAQKFVNGKKHAVVEVKCYWPENFANYVNVLLQKDLELLKSEFPKEYWQIVSNACILGLDHAEAVCFMPYESQMDEIRETISQMGGTQIWRYRFIVENRNWQLPVLPDKGYYKNLNIFAFEVPQSDKEFIAARIKAANEKKLQLIK